MLYRSKTLQVSVYIAALTHIAEWYFVQFNKYKKHSYLLVHQTWWWFPIFTHSQSDDIIPYSGKLSREKTFTNFAVLWLVVNVFSAKFGGVATFGTAQASNLQKISPQKSYFHQFAKVFALESFPLYSIKVRGWNLKLITISSWCGWSQESSVGDAAWFVYLVSKFLFICLQTAIPLVHLTGSRLITESKKPTSFLWLLAFPKVRKLNWKTKMRHSTKLIPRA